MLSFFICFFFNDTATTEIYTLSLHDALPILRAVGERDDVPEAVGMGVVLGAPNKERVQLVGSDRKSTRLNSSHTVISYAVFCLKKKKNKRSNNQESCQTDTPLRHANATQHDP